MDKHQLSSFQKAVWVHYGPTVRLFLIALFWVLWPLLLPQLEYEKQGEKNKTKKTNLYI